MAPPKHLDRLICVAPAATLGCAAVLMEWRAVHHHAPHLKTPGFICAGLSVLLLVSALLSRGRFFRMHRALAILMFNTMIVFGLAEVACRMARVDFNTMLGLQTKSEAFPIFFPPAPGAGGEIYFARKGPVTWTGKPLSIMLQNFRGMTTPTGTARSDHPLRQGWLPQSGRLKDWDIAIAGDSFTESGYLPYEELYSTLLGDILHRRVKNLGVSDSGNLSQSFYLRSYGRAPSCRTAVMAFFEETTWTTTSRNCAT